MILGRVAGEVVATIKHPFYEGRRMLMVDRLDDGGKETGAYLVAVAGVDAGVGQTVLVVDEGNSARQVVGDAAAPLRSVIIGVVDVVAVQGAQDARRGD